jgi:rubrerythrin
MNRNDILFNLQEALKAEYRAVEVYQDLLRKIKDKADRNEIEMVIGDERKHVRYLEEMIEIVNKHI